MSAENEASEAVAIRLVTQVAQTVLSFCASDKVRQTVCIRLARLFSDYGAEFGRRSAVTKQTPVPRVPVDLIETALSREPTERRKPSWMGDAVDVAEQRETPRAGLVAGEPVENRTKDHR